MPSSAFLPSSRLSFSPSSGTSLSRKKLRSTPTRQSSWLFVCTPRRASASRDTRRQRSCGPDPLKCGGRADTSSPALPSSLNANRRNSISPARARVSHSEGTHPRWNNLKQILLAVFTSSSRIPLEDWKDKSYLYLISYRKTPLKRRSSIRLERISIITGIFLVFVKLPSSPRRITLAKF
jgi:hypothetical protein